MRTEQKMMKTEKNMKEKVKYVIPMTEKFKVTDIISTLMNVQLFINQNTYALRYTELNNIWRKVADINDEEQNYVM